MYKTILISLISSLFIGCSSTNALKYFKADELEANSIQHTKKADLIINQNHEAIIWSTYLNNINNNQFNLEKETFIVSIYFTDNKKQDFRKNGYSLLLNNREAESVKEIDKEKSIYKPLLKNNPWAKHYLVDFEKLKRVYDLNLEFTNSTNSTKIKFKK